LQIGIDFACIELTFHSTVKGYLGHIVFVIEALQAARRRPVTQPSIFRPVRAREGDTHCACEDDTDKEIVTPEKTFFFVTGDESGSKSFLDAKPVGCGYQHNGGVSQVHAACSRRVRWATVAFVTSPVRSIKQAIADSSAAFVAGAYHRNAPALSTLTSPSGK
jgi:hypothetical protein